MDESKWFSLEVQQWWGHTRTQEALVSRCCCDVRKYLDHLELCDLTSQVITGLVLLVEEQEEVLRGILICENPTMLVFPIDSILPPIPASNVKRENRAILSVLPIFLSHRADLSLHSRLSHRARKHHGFAEQI